MLNLSFRKFCALTSILLCSVGVHAQEPLSVIDSIRVPASPAFKIVGTEPTSVERPTDLKALALDLSTLAGTGSATPSQFALEFGIAKLFSSGTKGLIEYYYPSVGSTMIDNLSLSFATAPIPDDMFVDTSEHASAAWSFGVRTHILGGSYDMDKAAFKKAIADRVSLVDNVDRFLKYVLLDMLGDSATRIQFQSMITAGNFSTNVLPPGPSALFDAAFAEVMTTNPALMSEVSVSDIAAIKAATTRYWGSFVQANTTLLTNLTPGGVPGFLNTYNDWSTTNILNSAAAVYSAQKLATMLAGKSGSFLEIAAAGAGVGKDDKVDAFLLKRYGVWLSYAYRPGSPSDWEGAAMLRMIANEADSSGKVTSYDVGLRASSPRLWNAAVSLEGVLRFSPTYKPDIRVAIIGEYPLSESFYLTATFGRGFDLETPTSGNLLSVLGIKFGLGADKLVITGDDLQP